jgi:hypothetical protein
MAGMVAFGRGSAAATTHPNAIQQGRPAEETDRLTYSMKVCQTHLTSVLVMGFGLP